MENYIISDKYEEIPAEPAFPKEYTTNVAVMKIKKGTNFQSIISYVMKLFADETHQYVIFEGIGDAADKCISCVEVFKRKYEKLLYQWNSLGVGKSVTYWNPLNDQLQKIRVSVDTPVMHILLSKNPFPPNYACASMQTTATGERGPTRENQNQNKKKPVNKRQTDSGRSPGTPNKWARPSKEQSIQRSKEKEKILSELSTDPN
ncbi:unnamed protein product [Auanema sp. JU1783]|nr:unnamed protein product [Auanema sp. JU1783]